MFRLISEIVVSQSKLVLDLKLLWL